MVRLCEICVSSLLSFGDSLLVPGLGGERTLKAALYGTPIGKFAKMASRRLAIGERNARL